MPQRTFVAKLFKVANFKVAGTLDGFIDLATPSGTYPLSLDEAEALCAAISSSVADARANCLYERDALLI